MIVPIPVGAGWGIGPSLFFLFGVLAVIAWFAWSGRSRPPMPNEGDNHIEAMKDAMRLQKAENPPDPVGPGGEFAG
ncbi:MAG: hypothetical protein WC023_06245 [Rhodocyclaceae bacterium]